MTFVHRSMRQRGADAAADVKLDPEAMALQRAHLETALTALRLLVEGNPRLAALMASRPALAPLLDCIEPSCRYNGPTSSVGVKRLSEPRAWSVS